MMMNNRVLSAMGCLDDDLTALAAEDMMTERKRKILTPKFWAKGIAVAASLCLVVGGTCGIWVWYKSENDPGGTTEMQRIPMKNLYGYFETDSFAKLKIDGIDEGLYALVPAPYNNSDTNNKRYFILKCTVVEDYYDNIESGTSVNLLIGVPERTIDNDEGRLYEELDPQIVFDFILQYEYVFACFSEPRENDLLSFETNDVVRMQYSRIPTLLSYHILPISDGKVDVNSLKAFGDEWNIRYIPDRMYDDEVQNFLQDGTDEDIFAENIRKYKETSIEQKNQELEE
ncbi:MAG: hypothetical protein ACI3YK_01610 [Eubacteriales bacterium]